MPQVQALVVDDEPDILDLLRITLSRMQIQTDTATTLAEARQRLEHQRYAFCLTDMQLPDGNGIALIRHIASQYPELPVAMITAHGNMESAVEAMKAGAFDFVAKPVALALLRQLVQSALRLSGTGAGAAVPPDGIPRLLGESAAMTAIRALIAKLARSQAPVFITGESGTGKELAARLIHVQGPRRDGPFVPVNCGAIPQELIESELFGHCKGSFTGAAQDREGLFQAAHGGTLFLDEIAELPLSAQVKLLRAIQEKAVRPVGARREIPVDARILSASHRDLTQEVAAGRFRQDLYYRLVVIALRMPALRERPEDLPQLAGQLLTRIAGQQGRDRPPTLSAAALAALARESFPGNVRELENRLERALALCDGAVIDAADLLLPGTGEPVPVAVPPEPRVLAETLQSVEAQVLREALAQSGGDPRAAAAGLGIGMRSLRHRLRRAGIAQVS